MPIYDANYQARMGMAEQIGETRGKIGIALSYLMHSSDARAIGAVQSAIELLQEAEAGLMELRRVPKRSEAELEAVTAASALRVLTHEQESGQ